MRQFHYKNNRLQQLKGFCYTVQTGAVKKAADAMGLTQAAVRLQIRSLERDLQTKLFHREKRSLVVTEEGKAFYDYAIPQLQAMRELLENFSRRKKQDQSKLIRIGANYVSIAYILPKYIKKFETAHSEVEFEIKNLIRKDALQKLINDELDFLLYTMQKYELPSELEFIPIVAYDPILLVQKDHPLTKLKKNLTLNEIKKYKLLRLDQEFVTMPAFDNVFEDHGFETKIKFAMVNYEILKKFVKADIGVAIISSICLEDEEEKDLVALDLSDYFPKIIYGILIKKGKILSGLLENFVKMLRAEKLLQAQICVR